MDKTTVQDIVKTLERLQRLATDDRAGTDTDITKKTEVVAKQISDLMLQMKNGDVALSKEEVIQLSSALSLALSIMGKEVQSNKEMLRKRMKASQAHKSYSQS